MAEPNLPAGVELRALRLLPDDRGSFLKLLMREHLPDPGEFGEIYLTTAVRGAIKGQHFHRKTAEWFSVIRGSAVLWLQGLHPDPGPRCSVSLSADRPCVVHVPPRIAHAFENRNDEPLVVLAYSDRPYEPNDTDTEPYAVARPSAS